MLRLMGSDKIISFYIWTIFLFCFKIQILFQATIEIFKSHDHDSYVSAIWGLNGFAMCFYIKKKKKNFENGISGAAKRYHFSWIIMN